MVVADSMLSLETLPALHALRGVRRGGVVDARVGRRQEVQDPGTAQRNRRIPASAAWIGRCRPQAIRPDDQNLGDGHARPGQTPATESEAEQGKLKTKLANAGFRSEGAGAIFLGLKLVGVVSAVVLGGGTVVTLEGISQRAPSRPPWWR